MGKKIVSLEVVRQLAMLMCTQREAAAFLDINPSTFKMLLRRHPEVREAWDKGFENGKISLRRKQLRLANSNPTMAIFLGKQYLNQRDTQAHELTGRDGSPVQMNSKIQIEFVEGTAEDEDQAS